MMQNVERISIIDQTRESDCTTVISSTECKLIFKAYLVLVIIFLLELREEVAEKMTSLIFTTDFL